MLQVVTGTRPATYPKWGYRVAKKNIHKLWHVLDVLKWLLWDGLLGTDILRTSISRRIQPLWRWEITMWKYPRPGSPNRCFSSELIDTEVDARVRNLRALKAHWPSAPGPASLREGVSSPCVSPFKLAAT
jgi:hypothetical protein